MDKVDKKIKTYGIILGVILFVLLIAGFTYANLAWNSKSIVISGKSNCLEVESVKGSNITGGNLLLQDETSIISNNQITIKNGMVITNVTAKIKSTCSISGYMTLNLNVTNLSSAFTSSGNSTGALKYVLTSYDPSTYSTISTTALNGKSFNIVNTGSITNNGTIKLKEENLSKTETKAYLIIFYIDGDMANNDAGSNSTNFKSNLEAIVTQGEAPKESAATFITNLYNAAAKTTVTNNSITYNYATSVGLMNDRFGSMSTNIDAGNIRYYGKSNITTVSAWQSDATAALFGTYDNESTCLEGFETNYNTCSPDVDGYENYGYSDQATCEAEYDWGSIWADESMTYNEGKQKYCTGTGQHYEPVEINNYIYFNCSDYSNQSSSTCETWRIIGVFDGKVKIMRGSKIGAYSWDNKNTSTGAETNYGKNDWTTARLMKLLNPSDYYKTDTNDNGNGQSLYWNAQSGTCFSGQNNATTSCDFTSTGLKNDTTRNLIAETTYTIKGHNYNQVYVDVMYDKERVSGTVYTGRPTSWTGKTSLPYASDYGYATDLNQCQKTLFDYENPECAANNWMKNIITNNGAGLGLLLTPSSGSAYYAWRVDSSGCVSTNCLAYSAYGVVPVLYLDSKLVIGSGSGSSLAPYQLTVNG